ncbi:MAG: hypothetical protein GY778_14130 [bacterium]|nr:hypothetical protein [bacterium]
MAFHEGFRVHPPPPLRAPGQRLRRKFGGPFYRDGDVFVWKLAPNSPPSCDILDPGTTECQGSTTDVALDGSGSSDPDPGDTLSFSWSTDCPGGTFDDNTLESPALTVNSVGPCPLTCNVFLTVDDGASTDGCQATVTIDDTAAPVFDSFPGDLAVTCGESTDPGDTGTATASDGCDLNPAVTHSDSVSDPTCPADPVQSTITRTWTATDACGNSASDTQTITVLKRVLDMDLKPGSCPNPFNRRSHGVLPVALLGSADFDVTTVDLASVVLSRADCVGGSTAPHEGPRGPHTVVSDVGTPFDGELCGCHELEGDGIDDLSMKFKVQDLVAALELDGLSPGSMVELVVSGELADGCKFIASDCLRLVPARGPSGKTVNLSDDAASSDGEPSQLPGDSAEGTAPDSSKGALCGAGAAIGLLAACSLLALMSVSRMLRVRLR